MVYVKKADRAEEAEKPKVMTTADFIVKDPTENILDTAPLEIEDIPTPKDAQEEAIAPHAVTAPPANEGFVILSEYENSPFPQTCSWLKAHGLDPENVGIGGLSKGGYRNLLDEDRNWPFTSQEIDVLWDIYQYELNNQDETEDTVGE